MTSSVCHSSIGEGSHLPPPPPQELSEILIVDDEPSNIHVLVETLRSDYRIRVATSGSDALELVSRSPSLDLIILDILMPGMDGYEVCRRLKQQDETRDIPVMFVTALDSDLAELVALRLSAVDYVTRPVHPDILRLRVGNMVRLKRLQEQLWAQSHLDGLTGLANRRAFDGFLEREWRRGTRSSAPTSLLLLDVDQFKAFNDRFGHLAGDGALREVACAVAGTLQRPTDLAARYGGEEFAGVLGVTDLAGARAVAEAACEAIKGLKIAHPDVPGGILTASIGVASLLPQPGMSVQTLIQQADQRLYEAKRRGGQCCVWED